MSLISPFYAVDTPFECESLVVAILRLFRLLKLNFVVGLWCELFVGNDVNRL